jgi:hypothetical protein
MPTREGHNYSNSLISYHSRTTNKPPQRLFLVDDLVADAIPVVAELPAEPRVFLVALGALIFCGEGSDEDDAALKRELRRGLAGALSSSPSFELARETRRRDVRLTGDTSGSGGTLSSSPLASSSNPPGTDVRAVFRDFTARSCTGGVGGECANEFGLG